MTRLIVLAAALVALPAVVCMALRGKRREVWA
jgi:hypothetical protein